MALSDMSVGIFSFGKKKKKDRTRKRRNRRIDNWKKKLKNAKNKGKVKEM